MFVNKLVVKLMVSGEAMRSCPEGGSLAYDAQGEALGHAMCSGKDIEIAEVWPGVSISGMTSIPRWWFAGSTTMESD